MMSKKARQDALIRQAFSELALEETRQLKDQLMSDPALYEMSEALHRRNRKRIFALIEKRLGRKRRKAWMMR